MSVRDEEATAEPAAEDERQGVPGGRAHPHQGDQRHELDLALAGGDAAEDDGELARGDQADSGAGLEERQRADERVGVGTERGAGPTESALDVGRPAE